MSVLNKMFFEWLILNSIESLIFLKNLTVNNNFIVLHSSYFSKKHLFLIHLFDAKYCEPIA